MNLFITKALKGRNILAVGSAHRFKSRKDKALKGRNKN